jgi:hypothetical protein
MNKKLKAQKLADIEASLNAGIAAARLRGFTIAPGEWGVESVPEREGYDGPEGFVWRADTGGCLCPMACVILDQPVDDDNQPNTDDTAAEILGLTSCQVSNFIVGFDAAETDVSGYEEDDMYQLGKKFRERVLNAQAAK